MKVTIRLYVGDPQGTPLHTTQIEIPDDKLELLNNEEVTAAVEMNVKTWAQSQLFIDWEVSES